MNKINLASYLCEDTNIINNYINDLKRRYEEEYADDFEGESTITPAEVYFLESYNEETGTVDFNKPDPEQLESYIEIVKDAGIKQFNITIPGGFMYTSILYTIYSIKGSIIDVKQIGTSNTYTIVVSLS